MALYKYHKAWTTFLDKNFEVFEKTLFLTDPLLVELRIKKVLSCHQYEKLMAIGEVRKIDRVMSFLEYLRSDLQAVNLQQLITILQSSQFRCMSAARLLAEFAVQIGISVPENQQECAANDISTTESKNTEMAQWLSLLSLHHTEFRKHLRILDAKQLSRLVVLGCINEADLIQIALIPRTQTEDKVDHFLAVLADQPPPHKGLLDKLILAFDSPLNSKTADIFKSIRSKLCSKPEQ